MMKAEAEETTCLLDVAGKCIVKTSEERALSMSKKELIPDIGLI